MNFNHQPPPPPPPMSVFDHQKPPPQQQQPPRSSHMMGTWSSAGFPQNLPPPPPQDDHLGQYNSSQFIDQDFMQTHKRPRQSQDNNNTFVNFPPQHHRVNPNPNLPPPMPPYNSRINPTPQPGRVGGTHIFYKTRPCVTFSHEGTCHKGESCNFAHGAHDLRLPPPNWQEIVGNYGRPDEEHRRGNGKLCKNFFSGKECLYGPKCLYLHERPAPPIMTPNPSVVVDAGQLERESFGVLVNQGKAISGGDQVLRTGSLHAPHIRNEADTMVKSRVIQSKPFVPAPPPVVVAAAGDPIQTREDDKASRWKLNKKVNRIYADWLDDLSPPRNVDEA